MGCCGSSNTMQGQDMNFMTTNALDLTLRFFESPIKFYDTFEAFPCLEDLESLILKQDTKMEMVLCVITGSLSEMGEKIDHWNEKFSEFNHQNLLMIHCFSLQEFALLVVPSIRITLLLDNPIDNLYHHPQLTKSKPLDESDIWYLIDCITAPLAYMQEKKVRCANLSAKDIYTVRTPFQKNVYKLGDRFWKPLETGGFYELVSKIDDPIEIKELKRTVIMSPLQVSSVPFKNKYPDQNLYKTQVFIFGMICLHCLDVIPSQEAYDWDNWRVRIDLLEQRLNILNNEKLYSETLLNLVSQMINIEENDRFDCSQLNDEVAQIFSKLGRKRLLDAYPKENFIFVPKIENVTTTQQSVIIEQYVGIQAGDFLQDNRTQRLFQLSPIVQKQPAIIYQSPKPGQHGGLEKIGLIPGQFIDSPQKSKSDISMFDMQASRMSQGKGQANGNRLSYPNGYSYEGQHALNKRNGKGTLFDENGKKQAEGNWVDDVPNGQFSYFNYPVVKGQENSGTHKRLDNPLWSKFDGQIVEGLRRGKGRIVFINGDCFEGEFKDDKVTKQYIILLKSNGKGVYFYASGQQVKGDWKNDEFQ